MTSYLVGSVVILLTTLAAVLGMLEVRRRVGIEALLSYHEVAGYLLSVVGTLYAVLLGFVVVDAMQHMQDVRSLVEQEANNLADVYIMTEGLPKEKHQKILSICVQYADV